ncbi:MAG: hypothetical protein ACAH89_03400 [Rariglobus sp.]
MTIEDLLRVKRAERPSVEFWSRFEQDLRAKQLAAIVEPRPWWIKVRLPQVARTLVRYQMPVGVAAVLALSFIVVREYRPMNVAPEVVVTLPVVESVAVVSNVMAPVEIVGDSVAITPMVKKSTEVIPTIEANEPVPVGPGELLAMIPWAAPQSASQIDAHAESAVLGELPQIHFAAAIKPASELHFEGSVEVAPMLVSAPVVERPVAESEAVAQVMPVSPREVRRNHILSSLVVADNSSEADRAVLVQAREVVSNSLTDDRLYDSVRRLGMGGDRLTLKF